MHSPHLSWLLTATYAVFASALIRQELIFQYDEPTWIENFAFRPDGSILPARASSAILEQLNTKTTRRDVISNQSSLGNAIMGITEVLPDLFAMNTMYCDLTQLSCTSGTGITWSVDLRDAASVADVSLERLVAGPDQKSLLNGMAALNENTVLMVDQAIGGIWAVDMDRRSAKLVIEDVSMRDSNNTGNGVNGIRVRDGMLYFNNPSAGSFNSLPIDMNTGKRTGEVRVIATELELDDFEVDEERGVAYITTGPENTLIELDLADGGHEVIVQDLPGPTSARWLSGEEGCVLYVSTTGGYPQWLSGKPTVGGAFYKIPL